MRSLLITLAFITGYSSILLGVEYERYHINGYTVYIVNTKKGNSATVMAATRNGFYHDPIGEAGLSHWLEHCLLNGSKNYPSPKACEELTQSWGGDRNASTFTGFTNYRVMNIRDNHLKEAVAIVADFMTQPLLDSEVSMKEREVVRQEVIKEYRGKDGIAFLNIMSKLFIDPKHPLSWEFAGSPEDVDRYTPSRIRELWAANYQPEDTVFYFVGNFSASPHLKEEALSTAKEKLSEPFTDELKTAPSAITPAKNIKIDLPFSSSRSPSQILWVSPKDAKTKEFEMVFHVDAPTFNKHFLGIWLLKSLLNLEVEGSLYEVLKQKGWITSFGASSLNSMQIMRLSVGGDLTEKGISEIEQVLLTVSSYIQALKSKPISEEVLRLLKEKAKDAIKQDLKDSNKFAYQLLNDNYLASLEARESSLNLDRTLATVTSSTLQDAFSAIFSPAQMIVGVQSQKLPELQKGDQSGKEIDRDYLLQSNPSISKTADILTGKIAHESFAPIIVKTVELPSESPIRSQESLEVYPRGNDLLVLKQDLTDSEAGMIVTISGEGFKHQDRRSSLASNLILQAFKNRYKGEITYLDALGLYVEVSLDSTSNNLRFAVDGSSDQALASFRLISEKLFSFLPTKKELDEAKEELTQNYTQSRQGFVASQAFRGLYAEISPSALTAEAALEDLSHFTAPTVISLWKDLWKNPSVNLSGVGNLSMRDLNELHQYILTLTQKHQYKDQLVPTYKNPFVMPPTLPATKDIGDMGIALGFKFKPYSHDDLVLRVLNEALGNVVTEINRSQRGLGYVHQVTRAVPLLHSKSSTVEPVSILAFLGGVDAPTAKDEDGKIAEALSRIDSARSGWKKAVELIAGLRDADKEHIAVTDVFLQNMIDGVVKSLQKVITEKSTLATRRLMMMENLGDPNGWDTLITDLKSVTPTMLRELARTLLTRTDGVEVLAVKSETRPCLWRLQDLGRLTDRGLDRSPLPKY